MTIKKNLEKLKGVLWIIWARIWFVLIPMRVLLTLENSIYDSHINLLIEVLLLIVLIAVYPSSYSSPKIENNEENIPLDESTDLRESKEVVLVIIIIEKEEDDTKSSEDEYPEDEDYEDDFFMENVHDPFPDPDRKLAHIVDQVDDRTFHARFCETASIVTCYLSHDLFHKNTRPLVGDLVRLEYSSGFGPRIHYIIQVIDSQMKEGSPWVWNALLAEIIGEDEEKGERIIYVRLEAGQLVPCKVVDYLLNTYMRDGDIVLLEVNETNRSFYKIVEIVIHYDSLGNS